jgi:hypothetical protein
MSAENRSSHQLRDPYGSLGAGALSGLNENEVVVTYQY